MKSAWNLSMFHDSGSMYSIYSHTYKIELQIHCACIYFLLRREKWFLLCLQIVFAGWFYATPDESNISRQTIVKQLQFFLYMRQLLGLFSGFSLPVTKLFLITHYANAYDKASDIYTKTDPGPASGARARNFLWFNCFCKFWL